jgi:CRISPR-associated protein Csb1
MTESRETLTFGTNLFDEWTSDDGQYVALHLKQTLSSVGNDSEEPSIVFPPTYAEIGYNIDRLANGTHVVTIDSVGSQANRLEPLFKKGGPLADLVPQIVIKINDKQSVSILDLPHRAADATVMATPGLAELASQAFDSLRAGDATPLCTFAPTSLIFGVWDSRGGSNEKRPRLIRSIIRAWDVDVLHAAAQFNSVWKRLDEDQRSELTAAAKAAKADLGEKGFKDRPATFRPKVKVAKYLDGRPNPEARVLGGVLVKGRIERQVTINLLALRTLQGKDETSTQAIRKYLLGLTLLAASTEQDFFLREGCLLKPSQDEGDKWYAIPRRGDPAVLLLQSYESEIRRLTNEAATYFRPSWPKTLEYKFDMTSAKRLLKKKSEEEPEEI